VNISISVNDQLYIEQGTSVKLKCSCRGDPINTWASSLSSATSRLCSLWRSLCTYVESNCDW